MKTLFIILGIALAISANAQSNKDNYKKLADKVIAEIKADTSSIKLTEREISILSTYQTKYAEATQRLQQVQKEMRELQENYNNVLSIRVEAAGGDCKKPFDVKGLRLQFTKR